MNWLYHFRSDTGRKDDLPLRSLYLRPYMNDPQGRQMVGKIIMLNLVATQFFIKPENRHIVADLPEFDKIVFTQLDGKSTQHTVEHLPADKPDEIYLRNATMYIDVENLSFDDVFEWIRTYMLLNGIPNESFKAATFNDFADTNPLMRMFAEAGKRMEEKGDDWYKKDDDV